MFDKGHPVTPVGYGSGASMEAAVLLTESNEAIGDNNLSMHWHTRKINNICLFPIKGIMGISCKTMS